MPWLRADDTFDTHPKIVALGSDERRWTWTRVLLYTCRHGGSLIPDGIRDIIPKATPAFLRDCIQIGLVDMVEDRMHVHDWADYNLSRVDGDDLEQRVADALADHPDASANEVHRMVGGRKQAVLSIVRRFRTGSPPGSGTSTEPVPGTDREPVTRAGARARPVPAPTPGTTPPSSTSRANPDDDDLDQALHGIPLAGGIRTTALDLLATDPARLAACVTASTSAAKPAAYLAELIRNGSHPEPPRPEPRAPDPTSVCADCGERLGHGHLETCPRMPVVVEDPEPAVARAIVGPPAELLATVGVRVDDPEPRSDPEPRVGGPSDPVKETTTEEAA